MEDRPLLSSFVLLDGLEFTGTGTFTQNANSDTLQGDVQIGYAPTQTESFNPLLSTNGQVTVPTTASATTFTIGPASGAETASLALYWLATNPTFWTTSTTTTFNAGSLTSSGQALSAADAQAISVGGVPFSATNLAFTYPANANTSQAEVLLQGSLNFSNAGLNGLELGVGIDGSSTSSNEVVVSSGSSAAITLTGIDPLPNANLSAFGVQISGGLSAVYSTTAANTYTLTGSVAYSANDGLGNVAATLGATVVNGVVQEIDLDTSGTFTLFGLTVEPEGLTFQYNLATQQTTPQFEMYGEVTLAVSSNDMIMATIGTADDPGLVIDTSTGDVSYVNMSVSSKFNVLGLSITIPSGNPVTLVYSAATSTTPAEYEISGTVTVPTLFNATVTLGSQGNPGLTIIGSDWSINDVSLSLSNVPLGAFEIQNFVITFSQSSSTEATVAVTLGLTFPEDWTVTGSIQLAIDESTGVFDIQDLSLGFQAGSTASAIPIGDTGLFLTEMSATVDNINQPSNLVVSGTMEAVYGKSVMIFGETASFFQVDGSFTVDKDELSLSAQAYFGATTSSSGQTSGLLGTGSSSLVLDWDDATYTLESSSSLLDGTFTYDATVQFSAADGFLLSATANLNVPHGIPLIGGLKLGSASFLFEYQAPSENGGQAGGFVAAWTSINLFVTKVQVGIEYNYVKNSVIVLGSKAINSLQSSETSESGTYTYSQSFTVPTGATQATLEVSWGSNSVLAPLTPTLVVGGTGLTDLTVTPSTTGTITLLQDTGLTSSTQEIVGIVGSTTNPYQSLGVTEGGEYTLQASFTSDVTPTNQTTTISEISEDPSTGDALVVFPGNVVPSDLDVGDTVSIADTYLSGYDTANSGSTAVVDAITSTGVVLNIPFSGDSQGGILSGWTLPQFSVNWDIPQPTVSINTVPSVVQSGWVPVTIPVQVATALASSGDVDVDLYVALYNSSPGATQNFNGTLVAKGIPLTDSTDNASGLTGYSANYTVDLSSLQLLPTDYYFYAVANDGINSPVTSALTGMDQVFENEPVITGNVTDQANQPLTAWTVFLDLNDDGTLDPGDPSTTTDGNGFYSFYSDQLTGISSGTTVGVDVVNLDPSEYSFGDPASGVEDVDYTGMALTPPTFVVDQAASIEGTVFLDSNQSGNSSGQQPLAGWTVFLDMNGTGQFAPNDPYAITTAAGSYSITELTPGTTYTVDLAPNTGAAAIYSFNATTVAGVSVYDIAGDPEMANQTATLNGGASVGTPSSLGVSDHQYASNNNELLALDGQTGYLSVMGTSQLQPGSSSTGGGGFTVGGWINGSQALIGGGDPSIAGTITSGAASGGWNLGLAANLSFDNGTTASSQAYADELYTADFNGDGKPDILALDPSTGEITVLLNTTTSNETTPTFSEAYSFSTTANEKTLQAAIADFNGDGLPDFVVSVPSANEAIVFLNTTPTGATSASFTTTVLQTKDEPEAIAAVTLNGPGNLPDVAVYDVESEELTVFMNQTTADSSTLDFTTQTVGLNFQNNPGTPNQIVVGDFNGDGKPDLAISNAGPVDVLFNTTATNATKASFQLTAPIALGPAGVPMTSSLAVGDFNNDGIDDIAYILTNDNSLFLFMGSTNGSFTEQQFSLESDPSGILVADLNGDGLPDVAVTSSSGNDVTILLNTTITDAAEARFSSATFPTVSEPTLIVTGEFNGDSQTDLAIMGAAGADATILSNETPTGSSTPVFNSYTFSTGSSTGATDALITGAFLGNGYDDLASTSSSLQELTVSADNPTSALTAEVEENPSEGSGSFSIQSPQSTVLANDTWYYVAFTYAPDVDSNGDDQLTLYVDGQMVAQSTGTGTLPSAPDISGSSAFDMLIGAEPGSIVSQFFEGTMDDLSIWQSALTPQEVLALYGGGFAPTYVQTAPVNPDSFTVSISTSPATDLVLNDNFGEFDSATITGSITGTPLNSTTSEPLSAVTVNLLNSSEEVVATTETASDGTYFFYSVLPGSYTIEQVAQVPWEQESPAGGAGITLTVAADSSYTNEDFTDEGAGPEPAVTGAVYTDANDNGVKDAAEVSAAGVPVYLDLNDNGVDDPGEPTVMTSSDGAFTFPDLAPGNYIVRVAGSSVGETTQPSNGYYAVNVPAQGSVTGLEFGLAPLVVAPIANVTAAEGTPVSFAVILSHSAADQTPVFYLAPGAPAGATIDPSTGVFTWTPPRPGTYTLTAGALEAGTPPLNDSQTFTIVVIDVAPVVQLGPNVQIMRGQTLSATGSFTEPGNDPWTATVNYGDGGGPQPLLLALNKTFDLVHSYTSPGTYAVTVVVNDGEGGTGSASFAVLVSANAPAPALSSGFGAGRDAFVTTLYAQILGQTPSQASLSNYSGRLFAGEQPLKVARMIWKSTEHRSMEQAQSAPSIRFQQAYRDALRAGREAHWAHRPAHADLVTIHPSVTRR